MLFRSPTSSSRSVDRKPSCNSSWRSLSKLSSRRRRAAPSHGRQGGVSGHSRPTRQDTRSFLTVRSSAAHGFPPKAQSAQRGKLTKTESEIAAVPNLRIGVSQPRRSRNTGGLRATDYAGHWTQPKRGEPVSNWEFVRKEGRTINEKTPVAFATGAIVSVRDVGGFTR